MAEFVELYFEEVAVEETAGGARGFRDDKGRIVYIPISLIEDTEYERRSVTVQVPAWFAEKEGLI
jgi:hypothetical protein